MKKCFGGKIAKTIDIRVLGIDLKNISTRFGHACSLSWEVKIPVPITCTVVPPCVKILVRISPVVNAAGF